MTGCPDPSVLDAFVRGTIDPATRSALEHHLDACPDCSGTVAEMVRLFGSASMGPGGAGSWSAGSWSAGAEGPASHSMALGPTFAGRPRSMTATVDDPDSRGSGPSAGAEADAAPVFVGRYRLGRRLGAGGMGVVFEAHDPELHRQVAIKLLHPGESDEAEMTRARLLREARAMARLAHPNVVAVYDVGRVGEQVFVAMELVEGDTLGRWLGRRRRSRAEILERFVQAGRGLQAAHEVGLVHRDFKPDNVLIGADERARVTDFGLAQPVLAWGQTEPMPATPPGVDPLQVSTAVTTAHGTIVGTPAYMAPEQWRGETVDARSDQFSLCVALYEALFGARPFEGQHWVALCQNVIEGRMRPVPRALPGGGGRVPGWLREALRKGLSSDPGQRFATMAELLAVLSRDRATVLRVGAIVGAMAVGAAATVGVLAWMADETTSSPPSEVASVDDASIAATEATAEQGGAGGQDGATASPTTDAADEACLRRAATVGGHWTAERREAIGARIARMEDGEALRDRALPMIDAWARAYTERAQALCRPPPTLALAESRRRCLDEAVVHLDAWALRVTALETFQAAPALLGSLHALPWIARCDREPWLLAMPVPPADALAAKARLLGAGLAAAAVDASLFQLTGAASEVERLAGEAATLGHPPRLAEAEALVGHVAAARRDPDLAVAWLERAALTAETAGHAEVQAAAAIALVEQQALRLRPTDARRWHPIADSLATRLDDPRLRAATTLAEGRLQHATLELQAAAETLGRAVDEHVQAYGPDHPRVALARVALAAVQRERGEPAEAVRLAQTACDALRRSLGEADLRLGAAQAELARAQLAAGRPSEALAAVERAVRIPGLSSSLRHDYDHGDALLVRGDVLAAQGDVEAALEAYEKAEIYHYVGPPKAQPWLRRGTLLVEAGRVEEGLALLEQALAELESHHGEHDPRLVEALRRLGAAQRRAGRSAEARRSLERALALADAGMGFGPFKARSQIDLAELERAQGHAAQALALYDDAHVPWLAAYEMDHPAVVAELLARADLAFALGQTAYAGRLYRSTYDRFEAIYGVGSPEAQRAAERRTDDE